MRYQQQNILPAQAAYLAQLVPAYNLFWNVVDPNRPADTHLSAVWTGLCLAGSGTNPTTQKHEYWHLDFICCNKTELLTPSMQISKTILHDDQVQPEVTVLKTSDDISEQGILDMIQAFSQQLDQVTSKEKTSHV